MKKSTAYWLAGIAFLLITAVLIKNLNIGGNSPAKVQLAYIGVFSIWFYFIPAYLFSQLAKSEYLNTNGAMNVPSWYAWVPGLHLLLLWKMSGRKSIVDLVLLFIPIVCAFQWPRLWGDVCKKRGVNENVGILMFPPICIHAAAFLLSYLNSIPVSQIPSATLDVES